MKFREKVSQLYFSMCSAFITIISCHGLTISEINCSRPSIQSNSFPRIGARIWNKIPLKNAFKRKIKQKLINILNAEDSYLDVSELIQKMKSFFT